MLISESRWLEQNTGEDFFPYFPPLLLLSLVYVAIGSLCLQKDVGSCQDIPHSPVFLGSYEILDGNLKKKKHFSTVASLLIKEWLG